MKQLWGFLLAWLPLLIVVKAAGGRWRPRRIAFGAALAAFAGGMCMVEFRRYGVLSPPGDSVPLPLLGLRLEDLLLFGILGAAGAVLAETIFDR